jgi:hypothetical protein
LPAVHQARFRLAFANFLRTHPYAWRTRRLDRMTPLDFYLARRQISLQGRILPSALVEYQRSRGAPPPPREFAAGEPMFLYVPFAVFPKQMLLDFSTADGTDCRVPLLTRDEGARVTALHLLNLIPRGSFPTNRPERLGAALIFETLAATDPTALLRRLCEWRGDDQYLPSRNHLADWLTYEAAQFSRGLGDELPERYLAGIVARAQNYPALLLREQLTGSAAQPIVGDFDYLSTLVTFSARESWRILARRQNPAGVGGRTPRHRDLLRDYRLLVSAGLRWIDRELRLAAPGSRVTRDAIRAEIAQASVSWMAYLATEAALDRPFQLKSSELLPFQQHKIVRRQMLRAWTVQRYHITPSDARSTHVEITTQDTDLLIAHGHTRVEGIGAAKGNPSAAFADHFAASHTIAHYYAAAQPSEMPLRDAKRSIHLRIRYKLPLTVAAGYWVLAGMLMAVFGWSTIEWAGKQPSEGAQAALLSVLAGFTFLLVWLTAPGQTKPLIYGKTQPFRWYATILLVLLAVEPILAWRGWI